MISQLLYWYSTKQKKQFKHNVRFFQITEEGFSLQPQSIRITSFQDHWFMFLKVL